MCKSRKQSNPMSDSHSFSIDELAEQSELDRAEAFNRVLAKPTPIREIWLVHTYLPEWKITFWSVQLHEKQGPWEQPKVTILDAHQLHYDACRCARTWQNQLDVPWKGVYNGQ